jgi:hypothetical protein
VAQPRKAIFISYRNEDSGHAARLHERLLRHFPADVFRDRYDIQYGARWGDVLREAVENCRVLIAVITPAWRRDIARLSDGGDWVQQEIRRALARKIPVLTIYAGGAAKLSREELPLELRPMLDGQHAELIDERDHYDSAFRKIVRKIEQELDEQRPAHVAIVLSLLGLAPIAAVWLPLALGLAPLTRTFWLPLLLMPGGALLLWRYRWRASVKQFARGLAVMLAVLLVISMWVMTTTPILVLVNALDRPVTAMAHHGSDATPRQGSPIPLTFRGAGESPYRVATLWLGGQGPPAVAFALAGLPNQCVRANYSWPAPLATLHLDQATLEWKGVLLYPAYSLFSVIHAYERETTDVSLELSLTLPSSAESYRTVVAYNGEPVWIGNPVTLGVKHWLPKLPADFVREGARDSKTSRLFQRTMDGPPIAWPIDTPCGVPAGSRLQWQLLAPRKEFPVDTGGTAIVTDRPHAIVMS